MTSVNGIVENSVQLLFICLINTNINKKRKKSSNLYVKKKHFNETRKNFLPISGNIFSQNVNACQKKTRVILNLKRTKPRDFLLIFKTLYNPPVCISGNTNIEFLTNLIGLKCA